MDNLKEITRKVIGPFRIGSRHFVEGTLLSDGVECVHLSDVVVIAGADHQEISGRHLVLVEGSPVHVVLDSLN